MPEVNLSEFSTAELRDLSAQIETELQHRRASEIKSTAARMRELAASVGMSVEEIMAGATQKKGASQAKYQNPDNPDQTWTGRGKRPNWVHEALSRGKSLEDLRIR